MTHGPRVCQYGSTHSQCRCPGPHTAVKVECTTPEICRYEAAPASHTRPHWDAYFLGIAEAVAARADCTRRKVGAVVVDTEQRIVSTGYNGSAPGGPSCLLGECPRGRLSTEALAPGSSYDTGAGTCVALHAEQNALLRASWDEMRVSTLYVTCRPCDGCLRTAGGTPLGRIVYRDDEAGVVLMEPNQGRFVVVSQFPNLTRT